MRAGRSLAWPLMALTALVTGPRTIADDSGSPIALFNGRDLSGWYIFIKHGDGKSDTNDPKGVFKVEDGIIHVSGEEFGCLTTTKEFADYHLTVEFKWGTKKWPPREDKPRDSGILLHCVGPDKVWTKSIECQIQEHDCGDFWLVDGTTIEVDGELVKRYRKKTRDAEKPTGEWNTVEVICRGDRITNIVNGVTVNEGVHASETKGKILLQSEGAEVFYRKVELRPLSKAAR
jgi:hypothetical protein